jgi:DNA topoisomerase-1
MLLRGKKLLIVESPGKLKTLKGYLGEGWAVQACLGHICDLPKKELGIDKEAGFKLNYEVSPDRKEVVSSLTSAVKTVGKENVFLATDPDREGEAISFHLCRSLGLDYKTTHRIKFDEITKEVVLKAIANPGKLDLQLVSAQEARRAIDRLVGFEISPLLWKKIKSDAPLSAGRVQSVAVKLVVEREKEIQGFGSTSVFKIAGVFQTPEHNKLKAIGSAEFSSAQEASNYLKSTDGKAFNIISVTMEAKKTLPSPPFNTSSLQQDANRKLKFGVDKTMSVAQKLYEAGHITYIRTDSVNLSQTAMDDLAKFIVDEYGKEYLETRVFKNKNESAQEAHEAIRPTHFKNKIITGSEDEKALYNLIYLRAVASQMQAKRFDVTTVTINSDSGKDEFKAKATVVTFDGFTKAYSEGNEEDQEQEEVGKEEIEIKEALNEGDPMSLLSVMARQYFTKPKNRYSEAELVGEMEKLGIGRPSTYASIMRNIKDVRKYVALGNAEGKKLECQTITYEKGKLSEQKSTVSVGQAKNKLLPSPIAFEVIGFLEHGFSNILDYHFTANCEEAFDLIAEGKESYGTAVKKFYTELDKSLSLANSLTGDSEKSKRKTIDLGEFEKAPIRTGKGEFGFYVLHKEKFFSVPDVTDISTITLEKAIAVITAKRESEKASKTEKEASTLHVFGKHKIINGKYGPYITNGKDNAPVPKWDLDKMANYDEPKCKEAIKKHKAYKAKK